MNRHSMHPGSARAQSGFTLLELLVVIAIIGILSGVMGFSLMGMLRRTEVRNAAAEVMADLRLARVNAQKTGLPSPVTIINGTGSYTAQIRPGALQTRTLDSGVTLQAVSSATALKVIYRAPFGTVDTIGLVWEVRSRATQVPPLYIKVVGITGKVILSDSRD
ncbi:Tfp pilus assembly protein FimT/FimU [Deinococcus sp. QL22]|uniref:pilus assembly FimT family protein n=1 Tax=Deinococcus sp. QL22 TaxID=2939437 RepID=UPI002016D892|nr:type II secretion system protein [Deinococcus sp. QL22]UQN05551.1 type II secretion system GspH family protein [Deinococcus sp. QL22]